MNVGIVDITATSQGVVLTLRHGHNQAILAAAEIPALRAALNSAEKQFRSLDYAEAEKCLACVEDDGADLV